MIICGIDPGLSGAVAWLNEGGYVTDIFDMPVLKLRKNGKGEVDPDVLADLLENYRPDHVFVEKVGPFHGSSAASAFTFGDGAGVVRATIATLKIPRTYVTSKRWKQVLRVPASKDAARARASELMPKSSSYWRRAKDDGRAEAALIALYGLTQTRMQDVLTSTDNTLACLTGNDNPVF